MPFIVLRINSLSILTYPLNTNTPSQYQYTLSIQLLPLNINTPSHLQYTLSPMAGVIEMSRLVKAKSGFSSSQFTVNGVVYTQSTLVDSAYPNMEPIICFKANLASFAPSAAPTGFAIMTQVRVNHLAVSIFCQHTNSHTVYFPLLFRHAFLHTVNTLSHPHARSHPHCQHALSHTVNTPIIQSHTCEHTLSPSYTGPSESGHHRGVLHSGQFSSGSRCIDICYPGHTHTLSTHDTINP